MTLPAVSKALVVATLSIGVAAASNLVNPGYDLFMTLPPTTFGGVSFTGVPIGNFNFGGTIGTKNTGITDTIVQRKDPAMAPTTAISTEMLMLQLMSTAPTNFGLGVGFYFITLQSVRGGPASTGRMTINFGPEAPPGSPHGTFDSFFDVFFDVRLGSLNGPIALSDTLRLTSQVAVPWNHFPPPPPPLPTGAGALQIDGVNAFLNGTNRNTDFWPIGPFSETHPNGAIHSVTETPLPEPGSLTLIAIGALACLGRGILSRRQHAA
jgi:hypothetical protein